MEQIFNGLLMGAAGILIGALSSNIIPGLIRKIAAGIRGDIKAKAEIYLTDPEWRDIAQRVILKMQKDLASETGQKRMQMAIKFFKDAIPTNLDDAIIEAIIQTAYDEATKEPIMIQ